ncbi:MAG: LysM domain-containing protein [Myxococcota bacterium]|nr:LysM domain-containing protein [Myxococcota bacterium]
MKTSMLLSLAAALWLVSAGVALAEGAPEAPSSVDWNEAMPTVAAAAAPAPMPEGAPEIGGGVRGALGQVGYDDQGREGRIHVVRTGDTLWDVSNAYLGTPWVWPSIWQDNRNIENPHLIYPGDHIWITPWEMRKVTPQEAEALLAGTPATAPAPIVASVPAAAPEMASPEPTALPAAAPAIRVSDHERVGLLSSETVDAAASIVANTSPRLMISQEDQVWIGLAAGETQPGDQFTVYRVADKVRDFDSGRMLGYHVELLGWVEVLETRDESSLAAVRRSASEMQIGDRLMPRRAPMGDIAIRTEPSDVEGRISFLPQSRTAMGTLDYVYLNRGVEDGLGVGSALEVYRKGFPAHDTVRGTPVRVSDRVVADLLVVRAEAEASVALVRRTEEELALGDFFRSGPE